MTIYPALLSDSLVELQQQLDVLQTEESISVVQIDIIDGYFADNITVTPSDLPDLNFGRLQFDLHLMVVDPQDYVNELIARADELPIRAVVAQVERMHNQASFLEEIRNHGWKPGLSLDLHTSVEAIDEDSYQHLHIVQLMGIEAGFQGQQFRPSVFEKIPELIKHSAKLEIIVDGGVKPSNIAEIAKAGIKHVAVGSALWQSDQISDTIRQLQSV